MPPGCGAWRALLCFAFSSNIHPRPAFAENAGRVDYVEVVDARSLQPVSTLGGRLVLVAVAAFYGRVRLIDNIEIRPPGCE